MKFVSRVRDDVLIKALCGEVPQLDYGLLERKGFRVYRIRDYSAYKPDVFLWTTYVDTNGLHRTVDGVPLFATAQTETPAASIKWLKKTYPRTAPLTLTQRAALAVAIDKELEQMRPGLRKILILYDVSVLVNLMEAGSGYTWNGMTPKEVLFENAAADSVIASTLAPLGWEIAFEPYGLAKRGSWCHSTYADLEKFHKSLGLI